VKGPYKTYYEMIDEAWQKMDAAPDATEKTLVMAKYQQLFLSEICGQLSRLNRNLENLTRPAGKGAAS
jgi:hypothetical protein